MTEVIRLTEKSDSKEFAAIASMINTAFSTSGDVIKELIRTAQSNPIVGIFLVYLLVDMFNSIEINQKGVSTPLLHNDSALALKTILAAGAGFALGTEVIQVIGDLVPFATGTSRSANPSLFIPSTTTLVNAAGGHVDPASAAELGRKT